ncbi:type VI secretion system baseplate subunit TssE [Melittangium boletus]|uniref:type VI secretion system baseplate subunit TssE n=1 Tax=Melittangium boletus TaxID=83453 RepID=UPI0012FDBB8C|nr:type VI secretion system baseplate subunit TssE [Melittangium boletus]
MSPKDPALAPLFDRLVEWRTEEGGPPAHHRTLDERELRDSIRHEVAHVLGTRCALSLADEARLTPVERSAVDYGLPDVGPLSLDSAEGVRHLEQLIARAVEAFEPRLEHIQVTVQTPGAQRALPVAVITARVVRPGHADTLSFPLQLDRSGRLVEVGDEFPEG